MTRYWLISGSAFAFGMMTSVALAQSTTNSESLTVSPAPMAVPAPPPPGPAGDVTVNQTRRTIDASGVERDSTQTSEKTQSFSSGNGVLSSDTRTRTSGQTTIIVPPGPTTTTTTTSRTTERSE